MSTKCQVCGGKSDMFLCRQHVTELRTILEDLPWWLERLGEAAVGQVRMSDGGRRTGRAPQHLDGDAPLVSMIEQYPNERETDLGKARQQRADQTMRRLLATGGVNARARDLEGVARNTVTTWVRHLGETRGITFVRPTFIGPLLASHIRLSTTTPALLAFLAVNVESIGLDEAAGECLHDFRGRLKAIERLINPPLATRFLGPCPVWIEDGESFCGTELHCLEDAIEITCPKCRRPHNVNRLQLAQQRDLEKRRMTIEEIVKLNPTVPEEYRVNERTLRHWRQHGRLVPCGWRRPNGREMFTKHSDDDQPLYSWGDIGRLRAEKPKRKVVTK